MLLKLGQKYFKLLLIACTLMLSICQRFYLPINYFNVTFLVICRKVLYYNLLKNPLKENVASNFRIMMFISIRISFIKMILKHISCYASI